MNATQKNTRLILVLGMHRSGTSAFARALNVFGVELGDDLLPAHPCNPKGFFEDGHIYAFNKALLAHLGCKWQDFPPPAPSLMRHAAHGPWGEDARALLAEKLGSMPLFGLKDPRMSVLMPFWRPVLAELHIPVFCLICLRHPHSVAHSLLTRDTFSPERSYALWAAHTLGAITGSAGLPRICASYETLLREPETALTQLATTLGLPENEEEKRVFLSEFLDKNLCHHRVSAEAPSETTAQRADIYGQLAEDIYAWFCPAEGDTRSLEDAETAARTGQWLNKLRGLPPLAPVAPAAPEEKPQEGTGRK